MIQLIAVTGRGNEILSDLITPLTTIFKNDLHRHSLPLRTGRRHLQGIPNRRWCPWLELISTSLSQIRALAILVGVTFDAPKGYIHYETNRTPEFTDKFPHGKAPALETPEGFLLTESSAIARYS